MKFTTKIDPKNVSLNYVSNVVPALAELSEGDEFDCECIDLTVHWTCEIEGRDWGIKALNLGVTDITGSFDVVFYDDEGDEDDRQTIQFDYKGWFKAQALFNVELTPHGSIAPEALEVDFARTTIEVE